MVKNENRRPGLIKKVLSEQIKEQLMEDLLNKKYKAGDRLVESAIAREFNVSQAPVREAIKSLVEMELLDFEPYKGITVRSFTTDDLCEVFQVRASLESLSARLAATHITPEEIEKLEDILEKMLDAAKKGDVIKRTAFNNQFHDVIIKASGNKLIGRLSRNLRFASWSHTSGALTSMDHIGIAKRHTLIVDSLRNGDPDLAEATMRDHILTSLKSLVIKLEQEELENSKNR
jgi:DNA-binding GntR family transcriptional regulator